MGDPGAWVLGVMALLALGLGPALRGFAGLFRVDDPAPSDAIVILLGGGDHRTDRAAELFRRGLAPVILVGSAHETPGHRWTETFIAVETLAALGVPRSAIRVLPRTVMSTRDEADRVAAYAAEHPIRRVTVVTTAFHTARARWIFRKGLNPAGVDVRMAAATNPLFSERDWYKTDEGLLAYLNEAAKTVYYRLRY